jgi:hypothetical protein
MKVALSLGAEEDLLDSRQNPSRIRAKLSGRR